MVVVGAGGHAIEILQLLLKDFAAEDIALFDDTGHIPSLAALYPVINSLEKLATHFATQSEFVLATGSPRSREALAGKCTGAGGKLTSVIASTAIIGNYNVSLGNGINVMHRVLITGDVWIGEGVLINAAACIHHGVRIGAYSEISPGALVLGGSAIGSRCRIGAGAVILPNVTVGDNAVVGAGAVVTRNIENGATVVGVPAKKTFGL